MSTDTITDPADDLDADLDGPDEHGHEHPNAEQDAEQDARTDQHTDGTDGTDHGDDDGSDEGSGQGGSKAQGPARGLPRATIRRIAAKAEEVTTTPDRIVEVAAALLGSGTGLADVTTAIMAAPRSATTPIGDLAMIADSDPMEAAINASALERDRLKAVWSLLVALDSGVKGAMPTAMGKAAIAVAKAAFNLSPDAKAEIDAVATLLRKN